MALHAILRSTRISSPISQKAFKEQLNPNSGSGLWPDIGKSEYASKSPQFAAIMRWVSSKFRNQLTLNLNKIPAQFAVTHKHIQAFL